MSVRRFLYIILFFAVPAAGQIRGVDGSYAVAYNDYAIYIDHRTIPQSVPSYSGLAEGLKAHWSFEDTSVKDSVNNHNGVINGTVSIESSDGILGNYASFPGGTGNLIQVDTIALTNKTFTISAWAKLGAIQGNRAIIGRRYGQHIISTNYDATYWFVGVNGSYQTSDQGLVEATWQHYVLVYDGNAADGNIQFYVNNKLVATKDLSTDITNNEYGWQIGAHGDNSYNFVGDIDEMSVWNRPLNEYEVAELYNSGNPTYIYQWGGYNPPPPPPPPDDNIVICGIGNSIMDKPYDDLEAEDPDYEVFTLAVSGDGILTQNQRWDTISAYDYTDFDYVVIQVGVNDISGGVSYSTMISRYQTLLSNIHGDIRSDCKIIMFTMMPCKGSYYVSDEEHENLKDVNTWIESIPYYVDYVSTANWDDLADGDYLADAYDSGDNIHPNSAGEAIITDNIHQIIQALEGSGGEIIVFDENFESWALQTNIPQDTFQYHWGAGADLQSESGYPDNEIADDAAIVSFGGSKVMKSIFLEGQCCVEIQSQGDGGTGLHVEVPLDDHYPNLYITYNLYYDPDFDNSSGHKLLGFRMHGDGSPTARAMSVTSGTYELDLAWQFYSAYYTVSQEYITTVPNTVDLELARGQWINITLRVYTGTVDNADGFVEVFYNGVFAYRRSGKQFKSSQDYNYDAGTFSWSTFMGGNMAEYYDSPRDQYHYIDDVVIWYPSSETPSQASASDRVLSLPTEANYPK